MPLKGRGGGLKKGKLLSSFLTERISRQQKSWVNAIKNQVGLMAIRRQIALGERAVRDLPQFF